MSSIFISGNGFDLAHGLPSLYTDFRNFLLKKYPESSKTVNKHFDFNTFYEISENEFAIKLLFMAMDNMCGENWSDFENALGYINFEKLFPRRSEGEKERDDPDEILSYLLFISMISELIKPCSKHWQKYFNKWIINVEKNLSSNKCEPINSLQELFKEKRDMKFLNFNYTRTLQKVYGVRKVIHIHNKIGDKLVFGHGLENVTYNESLEDGFIMSSNLDDFLASFKKNSKFQMEKYRDFFNDIDASVDKVYSYGFSFSRPDKEYIKTIIKKISPSAVWYFTKFECLNTNEIRKKKIKLRKYGFKGSFDTF